MISPLLQMQSQYLDWISSQRTNASEESTPTSLFEVLARRAEAGHAEANVDTVQLSTTSGLLAEPLLMPTSTTVQGLAETLSSDLETLFAEQGIDLEPPVEFTVGNNGEISVEGDRSDLEQIEELIAENPAIARQIRTLSAVSSHASQIERHLEFQAAYRASSDPSDVVARYSDPFGASTPSEIALSFGETGLEVQVDGEAWIATST
jgi:hypothetical protein